MLPHPAFEDLKRSTVVALEQRAWSGRDAPSFVNAAVARSKDRDLVQLVRGQRTSHATDAESRGRDRSGLSPRAPVDARIEPNPVT
jgi:hypothetical protein